MEETMKTDGKSLAANAAGSEGDAASITVALTSNWEVVPESALAPQVVEFSTELRAWHGYDACGILVNMLLKALVASGFLKHFKARKDGYEATVSFGVAGSAEQIAKLREALED
jgi:hypothetical protein